MALPGVYDIFNDAWKKYQTIYIISDTHFGENDLKKAYPNRLSDNEFINKINSEMGRKDLLIHLGDVGDLEYIKEIRGDKILIAGNHESGLEKYKKIFEQVYAGPLMIGEKILLSHEPILNCPWVYNCHGHVHNPHAKDDVYHFNFNVDSKQHYEPWNFNQWLKEGHTAQIQSLHRQTIDTATERKESRK